MSSPCSATKSSVGAVHPPSRVAPGRTRTRSWINGSGRCPSQLSPTGTHVSATPVIGRPVVVVDLCSAGSGQPDLPSSSAELRQKIVVAVGVCAFASGLGLSSVLAGAGEQLAYVAAPLVLCVGGLALTL